MDPEIQQLIDEYNRVELEQAERLRTLFYWVKARKGYRHIRLDPDQLINNCWDAPDRLDDKYLKPLNRQIVEVIAGVP